MPLNLLSQKLSEQVFVQVTAETGKKIVVTQIGAKKVVQRIKADKVLT
jgi:hypothetical protein